MAASSLDGQLYSSLLNAGASFTHTVTITDERMAEYNAAVNALKPSKRDKFKTHTKDGRGCRRTIHYSADPIAVGTATTNFYQKADLKQAAARHIPQGTRIPVISQSVNLGLAPSGDFMVRYDADALRFADADPAEDLPEHVLERQNANYTGQHHRNHHVRIPTRAGEPVRG